MSKKRILVLGHPMNTREVDGFDWTKLPSHINVGDYEAVVMDFTAFVERPSLGDHVDIDQLPSTEDVANLLFGGQGEVIAIGSPDLNLGGNPYTTSSWWLPVLPRMEPKRGTHLKFVHEDWDFYFAHLSAWSWHAFPQETNQTFPALDWWLTHIHPNAAGLGARIQPLATTRYGAAVAFQVQLEIFAEDHRGQATEKLVATQGAYWLPSLPAVDASDVINLLLHHRFQITFDTPPPEWVDGFHLPREEQALEDLRVAESGLTKAKEALQKAEELLQWERRFHPLLFEKGEKSLEAAVRDALKELGATVHEPEARGKEDARIEDPKGRKAVIEIKGRSGPLRLADVRQLEQWRVDAYEEDGEDRKSILVANLMCDVPPTDRKDVFPPNCLELAGRYGQALVLTSQLFRALELKQADQWDQTAFWDRVFDAVGPVEVDDLS